MKRTARQLFVLVLGATLIAAADRSHAQQSCGGCAIRTAIVLNEKRSNGVPPVQLGPRRQLDQLVERYHQAKAEGDRKKNLYIAAGLAVDEGLGVLSPGGGVPVVVSVLLSASKVPVKIKTAAWVAHRMEEIDASARMALADGLRRYRQEHNDAFRGFLDAYNRGEIPEGDTIRLIFDQHPTYNTLLDRIRPEDQHIVNKFLIKTLTDTLEQGMEGINRLLSKHDSAIDANWSAIDANRSAIDENLKNLTSLAQAFTGYAEKTDQRLSRLESNQLAIYDDIASLTKQVSTNTEAIAKNQDDIEFIQGTLFGKLTPAEQLQALEGGFFPSMSDEARAGLERKIKITEKRQKILEDVQWVLNEGAALVSIGQDLGIDDEIMEPIAAAVEIGTAASTAFVAFSSGNYLQGVAAITGLFGKKDVEGERHKAVMAGLRRLAEGQRRLAEGQRKLAEGQRGLASVLRDMMGQLGHMDEKLNQLSENQQQLAYNQEKIYGLMVAIGEDIQAKHEDSMGRLYELGADVLYNRTLIRERVAEKLKVCDAMRFRYINERVLDKITDLEGDLKYGFFPSYADIERIGNRHDLGRNGYCHEQLSAIFAYSNRAFHSHFLLETYKQTPSDHTADGEAGEIGKFLRLIYNPSTQLLMKRYGYLGLSERQILNALSLPVIDLQALDRKHRQSKNFPLDNKPHLLDELENALSPTAVLSEIWLLLDIYPFYHFVSPDGAILPLDEIKRRAGAGRLYTPGISWLQQALDIVDVTIAQQVLIAGDLLLPVMYEKLHKGFHSNEGREEIKSIRILLQKNPLLARNFILYLVDKELKKNIPALLYDTITVEDSIKPGPLPDLFEAILREQSQESWSGKQFQVVRLDMSSDQIGVLLMGQGIEIYLATSPDQIDAWLKKQDRPDLPLDLANTDVGLQIDTRLKEQYRQALENNDKGALSRLLGNFRFYSETGDRLELVRHGNKWAMKIAWKDRHDMKRDFFLPLPEAKELIEGQLLHTPDMSKLIELRNYIIEEIVGRKLASNENDLLNDNEYQLFNDLLSLYAAP